MKRTSDAGGIETSEQRFGTGTDFDGDETLIDDLPSIDDFEVLSGETDPAPERRRDPLRK